MCKLTGDFDDTEDVSWSSDEEPQHSVLPVLSDRPLASPEALQQESRHLERRELIHPSSCEIEAAATTAISSDDDEEAPTVFSYFEPGLLLKQSTTHANAEGRWTFAIVLVVMVVTVISGTARLLHARGSVKDQQRLSELVQASLEEQQKLFKLFQSSQREQQRLNKLVGNLTDKITEQEATIQGLQKLKVQTGSRNVVQSKDNWQLVNGSEARLRRASFKIDFPETFAVIPTVSLPLKHLDFGLFANLRVNLEVVSVNKESFTAVAMTWSGTAAYGISVTWVAVVSHA